MRGERRVGLLFYARRFGAQLTADETEEVALAILEGVGPWNMQLVAVPRPGLDRLTLESMKARRDEIGALFGL